MTPDNIKQDGNTDRIDPLQKDYSAGERWERCSDVLSWCSIVAFALYIYLHTTHDELQGIAKLIFVLLAVLSLGVLYYFRLEVQPRLDGERRRLLLSDSFR